ncbi:MAG: peptidyl-prolyl cis-trans isomerase [Planctomycetota bacterium]
MRFPADSETTGIPLLVSLIVLSCLIPLAEGQDDLSDDDSDALLTIDGDPVTQSELDAFYRTQFAPNEQSETLRGYRAQIREQLNRRRALQRLIEHRLLLSAARDEFSDNEQLDEILDEITERRMEEHLADQKSRVQFISQLHQNDATLRDWKRILRERILIQQYLGEEIKKDVSIRPSEIRRYYRQNRSRFKRPGAVVYRRITIDPELCKEGQDPRELAEWVMDKIQDGTDFGRLADRYSVDREEYDGGLRETEVPSDSPDWMPPLVEDMEPGEVSGVLEKSEGYTIVKLEEVRAAGPAPLKEVQDKIRDKLLSEKREKFQTQLLKRLRDEADIEYLPEGEELLNR